MIQVILQVGLLEQSQRQTYINCEQANAVKFCWRTWFNWSELDKFFWVIFDIRTVFGDVGSHCSKPSYDPRFPTTSSAPSWTWRYEFPFWIFWLTASVLLAELICKQLPFRRRRQLDSQSCSLRKGVRSHEERRWHEKDWWRRGGRHITITTIGICFSSLSYDFGDCHIRVAFGWLVLYERCSRHSHIKFLYLLFINFFSFLVLKMWAAKWTIDVCWSTGASQCLPSKISLNFRLTHESIYK